MQVQDDFLQNRDALPAIVDQFTHGSLLETA
jgi:hypothetical protein